ncbi:MAG TPA: PQQ-dependent sugar dehydrogenase [Thermoanaerobaculia bacterium]|jgi:glucose/arabinose dehydrogenase/PKD repeat protein|nr:PQQ-dependent sugar dehydrogenase [Thermoanaerobaculia bacterium]
MTRAKFLPLLILLTAMPLAAAVPAGFTDSVVATLGSPTALAFTPDGRLLITTQTGALRIYQGGALLATPALAFPASSICTASEQGLLGVAVDPAFVPTGYIFLFYTFEKPDGACVNRVSRFVLPDGNVINPATEQVLVDNMPSPAGNHNAGDLHFGRDGFLYISIGDGGCDHANDSGCAGANDAARDQHVLTGKILRITRDGNIPLDNPFQGPGTARCNATGQTTAGNKCWETFGWGLRNPFRFAMDPNAAGTRFFVNDVGQGRWEEIDEGTAGADYGWNLCEGAHNNDSDAACSNAPPGHVGPVYDYKHGQVIPGTTSPTNCNSITGGAFVPTGVWPGFEGSYLFGDFVCGEFFKLTFSGRSWSASDFDQSLGGVTTMIFGPHGSGGRALYYATFNAGGQVRKIFYQEAGNAPPVAVASADSTSGPVPFTVTLDATGSSDPDSGNTLLYFWDFGDGTPEASTKSLTFGHTYVNPGIYTATLRVRDNHFAFSTPDTVTIHAPAGPLDFFTVVPCRLVDTRSSGPALAGGSTRSFTGVGACGIPATAQVIAANVTAINPSSAGYLQISPGGTPATYTAVLNFNARQTRTNNALILLGTDGDFLVVAGLPTGSVQLTVDVVGWFE